MLRTAALYIVGGWVVMQVADVTFAPLDIPERALRYVLFALLAGFPIALIFGWFFDIGSTGIRRTAAAGQLELAEPEPLRRADYLVLAALLAVVAAILYNTVGKVVQEPGAPAVERPRDRSGPPMIAVLPFTTTSREGDSQFFATGVHDDLLTQLSKLQSIRVISRTSVMEYRDVARNLREIGTALGADVIMEGGVQIAGEQIRINAQLIDARNDEHLWAETYDRQLTATNIFEVQSDISRAITEALHTTLTEQDEGQLTFIPTENLAAYRAYRRAMDMFEKSGVYRNPDYRAALEEAVALDPTFTRAWAELGGHLSYINFWGEPNLEEVERAEEILGIVRELSPDSAEYLMALAYYSLYTLKDYDQAFEVITRAEEKAPSDLKILNMKTWILRRQGRHAERSPVFRKILELDPKNEDAAWSLARNLMTIHDDEAAAEYLDQVPFDGYDFAWLRTEIALRQHRDFNRYVSEIMALIEAYPEEAKAWNRWEMLVAARDYGAAEAVIPELYNPRAEDYPGIVPMDAAKLITYWLLGNTGRMQETLDAVDARLQEFRTEELAPETASLFLDLALPAALKGDVERTVRLVRLWQRGAEASDATDLISNMPYACQTYGIVGAASEAADCLRRGFTEPSWMNSFFEPHLPYYDAIRDSAEFQALLAEFD